MKNFFLIALTSAVTLIIFSIVQSVMNSPDEPPVSKETITAMENRSEGSPWSGEPFLDNVGDKLTLDFVKHIEGNEYEISYTNAKGEMVWVNTNSDISGTVKVIYDRESKQSYIERNKNKVKVKGDKVKFDDIVHTIHVSKGSMDSGKIERSCGKNCTEEIDTEIIGQ
jgi:hypothetical protein